MENKKTNQESNKPNASKPAVEQPAVKLRKRPDIREMFAHVDVSRFNQDESLQVYDLPEGLHAHFCNAEAKNCARKERLGYIPLDMAATSIGNSEDGSFKHPETGTDVKVYVCLEEHRQMRNRKINIQREQANAAIYEEELKIGKETPRSGVRDAPDDYVSDI